MMADGARLQREFAARLSNQHFDYFITLATNDPGFSLGRTQKALRSWDARVNRFLVGPDWQKRPDERTVWWAFPESLGHNPHWHLLLEIDPTYRSHIGKSERADWFPEKARAIWKAIVRSGTSNVQLFRTARVNDYVLKNILRPENWENFKSHLEFIR